MLGESGLLLEVRNAILLTDHSSAMSTDAQNGSDNTSHAHCELGFFHDAPQIHTHSHCKNCFRMPRCEGGSSKDLLRCSACSMAFYCVCAHLEIGYC